MTPTWKPLLAIIALGTAAHAQGLKTLQGPPPQAHLLNLPSSVVPNELVVRFHAGAVDTLNQTALADVGVTGVPTIDAIAQRLGVLEIRPLFPGATAQDAAARGVPDLSGFFVVTFDEQLATLDEAIAAYSADVNVRSVEPIGIHAVYATPNDGSYPSQWHLNQSSDHDIDAPEAWNVETGDPGVIVAVLDTGVRYFHKDLGGSSASLSSPGATNGNMWLNAAEKNGAAGVDDDGNGYVDDWVGWDFVNGGSPCWSGEDCSGQDNDPRDFNGHGTHCAGVVAAMNNNGYATASPAGGWNSGSPTSAGNGAKVMALRVGWSGSYFGQEVGFVRMDFAAGAFYYAANNGATIASCSWGSSNSGGIASAINYFLASGGLIFKAAGNDGTQTADYMCSRSDVYSVAATDQADRKASFSTYGTWVDISAPGVAILSSYHVHSSPGSDYIASLDGTSMATPMVAATAAAAWSVNPSWSASQVWTKVRDSADDIDTLNPSYAGRLGSGRINLFNTVGSGSPPPPPPTGSTLLLSFTGSVSVPGVGTVANEDIVAWDTATGAFSLYFDGSDVGLASFAVDALGVLPDGDLLMSIDIDGSVSGLTGGPSGSSVDDSDLIRFTPTSLGASTSGAWTFYFDGSDVGLTSSAEDIDAVSVTSDERIVISCAGNPGVSGLSGLQDEDLFQFTPGALGAATSGSWSYYFDGSDVGLASSSSEDVDAVSILPSGLISLSTLGNFSVSALSGADEDLFDFSATSLGTSTSGSFGAFFDGTGAGLAGSSDVNAAEEVP